MKNSNIIGFAKTLRKKDGGTITQDGLMAAGAVAIILVIVGLVIAFTKDSFMPQFTTSITEIFSSR